MPSKDGMEFQVMRKRVSISLKTRDGVVYSLILVLLLDIAVLSWISFRDDYDMSVRSQQAIVAKTLDTQIRNAALASVTRDNLQKHVLIVPTVDTSTPVGKILHTSTGFTADEKTIALLQRSKSLTYWIVEQTETKIQLAGLAWDHFGKPHYFRAERIPY